MGDYQLLQEMIADSGRKGFPTVQTNGVVGRVNMNDPMFVPGFGKTAPPGHRLVLPKGVPAIASPDTEYVRTVIEASAKKGGGLSTQEQLRQLRRKLKELQTQTEEETARRAMPWQDAIGFLQAVRKNKHFNRSQPVEASKASAAIPQRSVNAIVFFSKRGPKRNDDDESASDEEDASDVRGMAKKGKKYQLNVKAGSFEDWMQLQPQMVGPQSGAPLGSSDASRAADYEAAMHLYTNTPVATQLMNPSLKLEKSTDVWTSAYSTPLEDSVGLIVAYALGDVTKMGWINKLVPLQRHETGVSIKGVVMRFNTKSLDQHTHFARARTMTHSASEFQASMGMYAIAAMNTVDYLLTPEGKLVFSTIGVRWALAAQLTRIHITIHSIMSEPAREIDYGMYLEMNKKERSMADVQHMIDAQARLWNGVRKDLSLIALDEAARRMYQIEAKLPGSDFEWIMPTQIREWMGGNRQFYGFQETGFKNRSGPLPARQVPLNLKGNFYEVDDLPVGSMGEGHPNDHRPLRKLTVTGRWFHMPGWTGRETDTSTERGKGYHTSDRSVWHYNTERDEQIPCTLFAALLGSGLYTPPKDKQSSLVQRLTDVDNEAYSVSDPQVDPDADPDAAAAAAAAAPTMSAEEIESRRYRDDVNRALNCTNSDIPAEFDDWVLSKSIGKKTLGVDLTLSGYYAGVRATRWDGIPEVRRSAVELAFKKLIARKSTAQLLATYGTDPTGRTPVQYAEEVFDNRNLNTMATFNKLLRDQIPIPGLQFLVAIPTEIHEASSMVAIKGGKSNMAMMYGHVRVAEAVMPIENWWNAQFTMLMGFVMKEKASTHRFPNVFVHEYKGGGAPVFYHLGSKFGKAQFDNQDSIQAGYLSFYTGPFSTGNDTSSHREWVPKYSHIDVSGKFNESSRLRKEDRAEWLYPSASIYRPILDQFKTPVAHSVFQSRDNFTQVQAFQEIDQQPQINTVCSLTWTRRVSEGCERVVKGRDVYGDWITDGSARFRSGTEQPPNVVRQLVEPVRAGAFVPEI